MEPAASYAAVARAREKEMPVRVFIAMFIAMATFIMAPSVWPVTWLCAVCAYQLVDRIVTRQLEVNCDLDLPRHLKVAYVISTLGSSIVYTAITPYLWFMGGDAGQWFAIMASCGGMLHVALRAYPSKAVLLAGAVPHAMSLFGLPALYVMTRGDHHMVTLAMILIGAMLYIAHLIAGAQQSGAAMADLRKATAEANDARDQAERASAAKSQFLATVSHEIRTPMNAVLSAAHLLKRTSLTEEQAAHVAMLNNGGEVLVALLNDVLDISKIEAGKMELEEAVFNLPEALDALVALYGPRAHANGVELALDKAEDLPAIIRTDPLRLRQILFNLLSNAVKFTDHGKVTLRTRRFVAAGREWLGVEVQDTGCGIDVEAMGRLFGSFEQARATTARSHGGTGLGLAISHRLATLMGGDLTCESTPGKGSIFRLSVPLVSAPVSVLRSDGRAANDPDDIPHLSILVAEDHDVNRRIVALFLEPLGWRLTMALNGAEAVEAAGKEAFDVILMDMQMPVMDGVEAGLAIRAGGGPNAGAPIVALTANALGHHRDAWRPVDAAAFLTKPIDPELLVETLVKVSEPRRSEAGRAVA